MPREHGRRLAEPIPGARLTEIADAYVLSMLGRPEAVAAAMGEFLTADRAGRAGRQRSGPVHSRGATSVAKSSIVAAASCAARAGTA